MTEMIEQVIQWLKNGSELDAANLLAECSLDLIYVDTLFELQGEREVEMLDINVAAPRNIIQQIRGSSSPLVKQIEDAINEVAQSSNNYIRSISWVAKLADTSNSPATEQVSEALSKVDSDHIHSAWTKSLSRKHDDPEGAITAARTLVESVCKYILDRENIEYPNDVDLPKLYYLVMENLKLTANQQSSKLAKQILGNIQAVVGGLAALRNEMGDAHGKSSDDIAPDEIYAELAINLAGASALYLVSIYEKSLGA